jgi:flavin-dependent dehydrogenase
MYDAIVIGTGPSGSTVAKCLAEKGLKTLVIDKHKLPRNKSCSGVLIKKTKMLVEKNFGRIPDIVTCTPVNTRGIVIKNEIGKEFVFEDDGLNIWRDRFDYWLVNQACSGGAQLLESATVLDFTEQKDYVSLKVKRDGKYDIIDGRLVIACDGVNGISRKKLTTIESNYIITYQAFYHGTGKFDARYFYAFLSDELSEYDAWVNTKNNMLIIGVGVKKVNNAKEYFERFIDYLRIEYDLSLAEKLSEEFWTLPVIIPDFKTVLSKGRIFFAGEAAGLINPIGEGMSTAVVSGLALSRAIIKSFADSPGFNEQEIVEFYKTEMKLEIEHMKRQWILLHQISPAFWEKLGARMHNMNQQIAGS